MIKYAPCASRPGAAQVALVAGYRLAHPRSLSRIAPSEVYMRVPREMKYLWRAVDQEGEVLESFVITTRDRTNGRL
jgi:transposase-like protein